MQNAGLTNRKRLRRHSGVRWHKSPKLDTHTERCDVQPTGISRKVARIAGYLPLCQCATGVVRRRHGRQKSADAVVVLQNRQREGLNMINRD